MINGMILILILLIFRSLMAMSLLCVYISKLIRFDRASSHVTDFNNRNKLLTNKVLRQGYQYHKLHKAFSKFYRRHFELIEKYHVSRKKLMQQGENLNSSLFTPEFPSKAPFTKFQFECGVHDLVIKKNN